MSPRAASSILLLAAGLVRAEDVIPHRQDRPPNAPYSPEEALRRMTVPEGFTVELVASEPQIVNPVAMTFDDRGRIWIAESLEYPRREAGPGRDRVQILEDTDQDGRADRFTVFASGLNIPTGVAVGHGGVWILNAPDLLFCREQDGKEVSREVVVTGFGRTDTHELPSSLTWGPDGRLYGLNGVFNHSRVISGGREFAFTCALWRVDPRTRRFEVVCEGTSNPWGLAWDREGSAMVSACHWATDHVFHFVETGYYQRQAGAYPPYAMKIGSITTHGHQKTAYCGLAYLDSDAYPERYRERLYMGNIHGGCINVDRLRRDGSTYVSEAESDFLSANDAWFMPVSQKVGPDGCLYVLDWYDRYHCYQDAGRDPHGIDRLKGRLYRVRHRDSPRAPRFDLAAEADERLVDRLASPNIYFRESAQRLLAERGAPAARERLETLALDSAAPRKARLHALWALVGSGPLRPEFHQRLLAESDAAFRAWGVRAAGNAGKVDPTIRERVVALARDPSPDVLLQVAIAARKLEGLDPLPVLVAVLVSCGQDKLIPSIVWPNLHPLLETEGGRFAQLAAAVDLTRAPGLGDLLPRSVERLLGRQEPEIESIQALVEHLPARDPARAALTLAAASRGLASLAEPARRDGTERLEPLIRRLLEHGSGTLRQGALLLAARLGLDGVDLARVRELFVSARESEASRLEALEALIAFRDASLATTLAEVIAEAPAPFLVRVLASLGASNDPNVGELIVARYPSLAPDLQPLAIELLLEREPWARKLLDAVRAAKLPRSVLTANHLRKILESNDREAVWAVEKTWGTVRAERNPEQERVVAEMTDFLRRHAGDVAAGERVFKKLCAQCHRLYGEGRDVGPDLTSNGRASFEQLVSNVFDPSLVIGPGYQVTTIVTADGRNVSGIVVEDSERGMTLKLAGGEQAVLPRNAIKYTRRSELSMMPEGIEQTLERQEIADLFAYLCLDRPPGDPQAKPIAGTPAAGR